MKMMNLILPLIRAAVQPGQMADSHVLPHNRQTIAMADKRSLRPEKV